MEKSIEQIKTELHEMFPQYRGFIEHTLVAKMCKDYHESELKNLRLDAVSQQRELLIAFARHEYKHEDCIVEEQIIPSIDEFLSNL